MATSHIRKLYRYVNFANSIIFIGIVTAIVYIFSYIFPVTDNAFIVNNVRPVAALVNGYVTNIYVKNGEYVKKGQKLFTVYDQHYQYAYLEEKANLLSANAKLLALENTKDRDIEILHNQQAIYTKLAEDDDKYQRAYKISAVSLMTLQNSEEATKAAKANVNAAKAQITIDEENILSQKGAIAALAAQQNNASVDLAQTIVYASSNGIIQNFFLSLGTPVNINQPLFSFVDNNEIFLQANFNETDLRKVKNGDKVLIFPRTYLGAKIFHGIIISDYWAANRQSTDSKTQLQNVENENQWVLLPQRVPVQIKVTDPDPNYPLRVGTSAYVYIQTK